MSGNRFLPGSRQRPIQNNARPTRSPYPKTAKQMERHFKGIANHRRIEILFVIAREDGISVEGIANNLRCNFKTISEHIRRLAQADLVEKKYKGRYITHQLTPYGRTLVAFLTTFSHS